MGTNLIIFLIQNYFTRNLEGAKEANKVRFFEKRVWSNLTKYLRIAIPSMFFVVIEWSTYQVQIIMTGYIGVKSLATQTIYMQYVFLLSAIPMGIMMTAVTLVGS